jgi:hypothetical protein
MTTLTLTHDVDTLGALLAQIDALTTRANAIKDAIKEDASLGGDKIVDGDLFRATYSESNRSTVDWLGIVAAKVGVQIADKEDAKDSWKKVAIAVGYDAGALPKAIASHTKTAAVYTVKVTSK